jgi:hypothetical protein
MNFIDVVFDRYGAAQLRVREDGKIFTFYGKCIGFVRNEAVYNYTGLQVGWFSGGILRDLQGNTAGFGENPTDSPRPLLPIRQIKPIPNIPEIPPIPPIPEIRRIQPIKSFSWSILDPQGLFFSRGYNG